MESASSLTVSLLKNIGKTRKHLASEGRVHTAGADTCKNGREFPLRAAGNLRVTLVRKKAKTGPDSSYTERLSVAPGAPDTEKEMLSVTLGLIQ